MSKFIEVHDTNGKPLTINIDHISQFKPAWDSIYDDDNTRVVERIAIKMTDGEWLRIDGDYDCFQTAIGKLCGQHEELFPDRVGTS